MNESRKEDLLIVGSLAFDSVETPKGKVERALGGSASYASIAASYFSKPRVVGIVGEDFGEENMDLLNRHGVDTEGIEKAPGKTFHWRGKYRANFKERDTLETCLNVFEGFNPVLPGACKRARFVFLGNIDPELQNRVLDQVEPGALIGMDTMNFWIKNSRSALLDVIKRSDILFINDEEALELTSASGILDASEELLSHGTRHLIVKRGEFGALLFSKSTRLFVPAVLLSKVIDPTGAGDAFAGGFMGSLSKAEVLDRRALANALLTATAMASFSVEEFSVDGLVNLSMDAIDARIEELKKMIAVC